MMFMFVCQQILDFDENGVMLYASTSLFITLSLHLSIISSIMLY